MTDGLHCLQMRVTLLSTGAGHTFPSDGSLLSLSLSFPLSYSHTHSHTMKRPPDDQSPLATGLGNLPNCSRLIESLLADAIATGRNKVWPAGIICAYCQPGMNLWGKMTCEPNEVQHIYLCCPCRGSRTTSDTVFNPNRITMSHYRYNNNHNNNIRNMFLNM